PATPGGSLSPMPYFAVPVLRLGWMDSPNPAIEPGPLGSEIAPGATPFLSAARHVAKRNSCSRARHGGMTNDEIQMTKELRSPNDEARAQPCGHWASVIGPSC